MAFCKGNGGELRSAGTSVPVGRWLVVRGKYAEIVTPVPVSGAVEFRGQRYRVGSCVTDQNGNRLRCTPIT